MVNYPYKYCLYRSNFIMKLHKTFQECWFGYFHHDYEQIQIICFPNYVSSFISILVRVSDQPLVAELWKFLYCVLFTLRPIVYPRKNGQCACKTDKKMHLLFNPLQFLLVPSQAFLTTCYMSVCKSGLFGGVGCFSQWFSPFFRYW